MPWVIELRRADAVKQGDVILAQRDGLLGPWRVVDASMQQALDQPQSVVSPPLSVLLNLMPQQGASRGLGIMEMRDERSLVPVLVPLPEPERHEYPHGPVVLRSGRLEVRLLDE